MFIGGGILFLALVIFQLIFTVAFLASLHSSSKERAHFTKEIYGLLRKIEGLTASRRELLIKQYDRMHESLTARLPSTIAACASDVIFETESKILKRLAELEPNLKDNEEGRRKMDELIRSMETLEQTIIALTADTVKKVMTEEKHEFFQEQKDSEISLAA